MRVTTRNPAPPRNLAIQTGLPSWFPFCRGPRALRFAKALDRQHQGLFDTINELNDALTAGHGQAAVDSILEKFVNYAQTHFNSEEVLTERFGFPGLPTHRAERNIFVAKVSEFLKDYAEGKAGVPVALLLFLRSWLRDHILRKGVQRVFERPRREVARLGGLVHWRFLLSVRHN